MICIQNPKSARSAATTALYGIFSSENFHMWTLTAGIIRCQHHAEFSIRKISTPKGPIHLSFLFSFQVPVKLRSRLFATFPAVLIVLPRTIIPFPKRLRMSSIVSSTFFCFSRSSVFSKRDIWRNSSEVRSVSATPDQAQRFTFPALI